MTEYREVIRAIIENDDGKVLLGKRGNGIGEGMYALVGGKPDPGETPLQTIKREILEELGIKIELEFYLTEPDENTDPEKPWRATFFIAKIDRNQKFYPKPDEILDVIFVGPEDLDTIQIAFDHKEKLQEYFRNKVR